MKSKKGTVKQSNFVITLNLNACNNKGLWEKICNYELFL